MGGDEGTTDGMTHHFKYRSNTNRHILLFLNFLAFRLRELVLRDSKEDELTSGLAGNKGYELREMDFLRPPYVRLRTSSQTLLPGNRESEFKRGHSGPF